jgi:glycosyltransferase involved in cell wall biosynthesis
MLAQTAKPVRWIIVDDGSVDHTSDIIGRYTVQHEWISVIRLNTCTKRQPGSAVVHAFNVGYQIATHENFDFIVKLDCDVRLPPTYFEQLLAMFNQDPRLGIASGTYVERQGNAWTTVQMPDYHAAGASKVIRAQCFKQIGGFVASRGWDTVDEIRAQALGWRTRHFPHLTFDHLRPEGSSRGSLYTNRLHGEVFYLTGGPLIFFLLKVAHRMIVGRPAILAGLMLLGGYLKPMLLRRNRLVSAEEARYYRSALNHRLWRNLTQALGRLRLKLYAGRQV